MGIRNISVLFPYDVVEDVSDNVDTDQDAITEPLSAEL